MSETKIYGTSGHVLAGATTIHVDSHSIAIKSDIADVSTTETIYEQIIAGKLAATLSFKFFWYVEGAPDTLLAPGASLTFVPSIGPSGKSYSIPAIVADYTLNNPNRGAVSVDVVARSNGAWTAPTFS